MTCIPKIEMPPLEKSVANDCVAAVIEIIDKNCENPSRMCLACKRSKRCPLPVKIAHDAFCSTAGLIDSIDHDNWYAARAWQQQYSEIRWVKCEHVIIKKTKGSEVTYG